MPDNPRKTKQDAKLVALTQPYEVRYFARKWGLKTEEARAIIKQHGPSRKACDAAVIAANNRLADWDVG